MVRSAAVRGLAPLPDAFERLRPLRRDPTRLVRLDAGMATAHRQGRDLANYEEIMTYLDSVCDQPAGALRRAQFAFSEGRLDDAERWARRVAEWETTQPMGPLMLGRVHHAQGRLQDAEVAMLNAVDRLPTDAESTYALALLYAETGRPSDALGRLKQTVANEPEFGRAWYNLGLAHAQFEQLDEAAKALSAAEALMVGSPDPAYARATIHLRQGDVEAAQAAAEAALSVSPGHPPSLNLLQSLAAPRQGSE